MLYHTTCINAATLANVCDEDCLSNSFILKWSVVQVNHAMSCSLNLAPARQDIATHGLGWAPPHILASGARLLRIRSMSLPPVLVSVLPISLPWHHILQWPQPLQPVEHWRSRRRQAEHLRSRSREAEHSRSRSWEVVPLALAPLVSLAYLRYSLVPRNQRKVRYF
jgi:hypothetical protein